ncbi:hypothetical protein EV714DRAFT_221595 [Schizophyllum commune]
MRGRRLIGADGSDPGVAEPSSPLRTQAARIRSGHANRVDTLAEKQAEREEKAEREHEAREQAKREVFTHILEVLDAAGATFGELLLFVLSPENFVSRGWRWINLYSDGSVLPQAFAWMALEPKINSGLARSIAVDGMLAVVSTVLGQEADDITQSGVLRPPQTVDEHFVLDYSFEALPKTIQYRCPRILKTLMSISKTQRQEDECSEKHLAHKTFVTAAYATMLLGERSRRNSWFRHVLGLYLYSAGATRQLITVLNHLGISVSYTTLAGRGGKTLSWDDDLSDGGNEADDEAELDDAAADMDAAAPRQLTRTQRSSGSPTPGTLQRLSRSMRLLARRAAATFAFLVVYDNINMNWKVAEQLVGRTDSLESGTCATLVTLYGGQRPSDMRTTDLDRAFHSAGELTLDDILLTPDELRQREEFLVYTILRLVIRYGGAGLRAFRDKVLKTQPATARLIPLHRSKIYPLPAYEINEGNRQGNAEFIDAIMKELRYEDRPEVARLIAGDQLSIARAREVIAARSGNEGSGPALHYVVPTPGLFHYQMAAVNGFLHIHLGTHSHDMSNPASLHAHNTLLRRKPLTSTSLPPYQTLRDLIDISAGSRALDRLVHISGKGSLEAYSANLTWDALLEDARKAVRQFMDTQAVHRLRRARKKHGPGYGDMVYENGILFMRDALLLREFTDAIKAGDSGRIILVLKTWALSFRAQGRTNYAQELLYLIHNLTKVWPPHIRDVVLQNWLVNPSGKANGNHPVDLLQEHHNLLIKVHYQAHGGNASWEWTATVAPCIAILRRLNQDINRALGGRQGARHAEADLSRDVAELMSSLAKHRVYDQVPGRMLAEDDLASEVPDTVSVGLTKLMNGTDSRPLDSYNAAFRRLQQRRRIRPLVDGTGTTDALPELADVDADAVSLGEEPSDAEESEEDVFQLTLDDLDGLMADDDEEQDEGEELDPDEEYNADEQDDEAVVYTEGDEIL